MPDDRTPDRRLYLHVGLPGTGAAYLGEALLAGREALAEQGVDLVPPTRRASYAVMRAVRGRHASEHGEDAGRATLEEFSADLADAPGPRAVYSHESLAEATPRQVDRLLDACGDREIHVVLTARDLAQLLSSSWQQALEAGRSVGYRAHLRKLEALEEAGSADAPWINLDPVRVLDRWSAAAPPERMHVVTVPAGGSPPLTLLERFCEVLDVDPSRLDAQDGPSNTGLGRVQAEMLRRVNAEVPAEVRRRGGDGNVGKRFFRAGDLSSEEPRTILVPQRYRAWCEDVTERQIAALEHAGCRVVGSLADLRSPEEAFTDEDVEPGEDEIAAASVAALAGILARRGLAEAERRSGRIVVPPRRWERLRRLYRRLAR
jgi:hypothetical protein